MANMEEFQDGLNEVMTDVRRFLDSAGLEDWQEYLIVRRFGKEQSFIVLANPRDKSTVANELIEWHKARAGRGQ